jgi:pyrroline-5-carboxylate reductase
MGSALLRGVLNSKLDDVSVNVYDIHHDKLEKFNESKDVEIIKEQPKEAKFDYIFMCIKPTDLEESSKWIKNTLSTNGVVVSLLAGIETTKVQNLLGRKARVVRAMPNICATVHQAATAISTNDLLGHEQIIFVKKVFNTIGSVVEVKESLLDAVTGLSGSGPAYLFMIIESLIDGGVKMGIPRNIAKELVIQTVKGSCDIVEKSGQHPAVLKDMVTTPGGTTIHAIHELESHGLRSILISAVATATKQSEALGKK